jgi:hypothetical protein
MAKSKTKRKPKTQNKSISEKEEINIGGKKFKVALTVADTLRSLADALHAHEIALLTWVHKDYNGTETEDLEGFRKSLDEYCKGIPNAENILVRMGEIDKKIEEEKNKTKENKKTTKEEAEAKE